MSCEIECALKARETKFRDLWVDAITKYLPNEILEWVDENLQFEYQSGACAIAFHKSQFTTIPPLKRKPINGIVLLCDSLLSEPPENQEFIVLHEIAHYILKHDRIEGKFPSEQEMEADELARKWIYDHNKPSENKN